MSKIRVKTLIIFVLGAISILNGVLTLKTGQSNAFSVIMDDFDYSSNEDASRENSPENAKSFPSINLEMKMNIQNFDPKYGFVFSQEIKPFVRPKEESGFSNNDAKNWNNEINSVDSSENEIQYGLDLNDPPPYEKYAKMARYIVKTSNWTSVATISSRSPTQGFPFANVFSVSDGPLNGNCTGIPYFYLTPLEISVQDLKIDSRASMTMSLAQGDYCRLHSYDPEDPRCAHVILTGNIRKVESLSNEEKFAKEALFARHPEMAEWPQQHGWFFAKMEVANIIVLDFFGGAQTVTPTQYFNANL